MLHLAENDLYMLIQGMETKEARRFLSLHKKKTSGAKGEKKYVQLFKAYQEDTPPSDAALRKRLKLGPGSALPMLRQYLYDELLDFLLVNNPQETSEFKLTRMLNQAVLLGKKGLPGQGLKLMRKVYQKAKLLERFTIALEAQYQMLTLLPKMEAVGDYKRFLEDVWVEKDELLAGMHEIFSVMHEFANRKMVMLERKGSTDTPLTTGREITSYRTFTARSILAKIRAGAASASGDPETAFALRKQLFDWFEEAPAFKMDRYASYQALLFNLCTTSLRSNHLMEAHRYLVHQVEMIAKTKKIATTSYQKGCELRHRICELYYVWRHKGLEAALPLVEQYGSDQAQPEFKGIWQMHSLTLRVASTMVLTEARAYTRSLKAIAALQRDLPARHRADIRAWCDLMALYLNFLTGDRLYIIAALRNFLRAGDTRGAPKVALALARFLRYLLNHEAKSPVSHQKTWRETRTDIDDNWMAWTSGDDSWRWTLGWIESVLDLAPTA
ncbi:MAG: hypothetical protein AAF570_10595 [Bacteroidota bacterium]